MSYRLFLFDLDGTLVDTSPGILEALRRMEREVGAEPLPQKTLEKFIGPPLEWSMETYYGQGMGGDLPAHLYRGKLYREVAAVPLYPGVTGTDQGKGRQMRGDLPENGLHGGGYAGGL